MQKYQPLFTPGNTTCFQEYCAGFILQKDSNVFCGVGQAFGERTDTRFFVPRLCKILKPVYESWRQVVVPGMRRGWYFIPIPCEISAVVFSLEEAW